MDSKCCNSFNIIIIGDSGIGKSSLLYRYTNNIYSEFSTSTIGLDFKVKYVNINNVPIEIKIWDTAGLERFRSITENYYNGADAILLCFDVTNKDSLKMLEEWNIIHKLNSNIKKQKIIKLLVAMKVDNEKGRYIATEDGQSYASTNNYLYTETSSKNNINVDKTFTLAITELLKIRSINNLSDSIKPRRYCSSISFSSSDETIEHSSSIITLNSPTVETIEPKKQKLFCC
jgi:Ras-related protein Rab-18